MSCTAATSVHSQEENIAERVAELLATIHNVFKKNCITLLLSKKSSAQQKTATYVPMANVLPGLLRWIQVHLADYFRALLAGNPTSVPFSQELTRIISQRTFNLLEKRQYIEPIRGLSHSWFLHAVLCFAKNPACRIRWFAPCSVDNPPLSTLERHYWSKRIERESDDDNRVSEINAVARDKRA